MNETQREVLKSTVSVAIDDILENASTALLRRCIAPAPATIDKTSPNQNQNFRNDIHQLVRQFQHVPEATLKFAVRLREAYLGMTPAIDFQITTLNLTYNENIRGVPFGLDRMGDAPAQRDIQQVMRHAIEKQIAKAEGHYESKKKMPAAMTSTPQGLSPSRDQPPPLPPRNSTQTTSTRAMAPMMNVTTTATSARTARYLQSSSDAQLARQLQMDLLAQHFDELLAINLQQEEYQSQQRAERLGSLPQLWGRST